MRNEAPLKLSPLRTLFIRSIGYPTLAVATYGGVRANPVLLARSLWVDARKLEGDEGARVLMRTHPVVEVACDGTGHPDDVDTVEDLQAMEHTLEREMES